MNRQTLAVHESAIKNYHNAYTESRCLLKLDFVRIMILKSLGLLLQSLDDL